MPNSTFGAEVRLGGGQRIEMDRGTVRVINDPLLPLPEEEPEVAPFHYQLTVEHKKEHTRTQAFCAEYDALIAFAKQLEQLDYMLLTLEQKSGPAPSLV